MSPSTRTSGLIAAAFATLSTLSTPTRAGEFEPFAAFIARTTAARAATYLVRPDSRIGSVADFKAMRAHILRHYTGVTVKQSFVADAQHFDCVPVLQQPSARALALKAVPAPPSPAPEVHPVGVPGARQPVRATQFGPGKRIDAFGNATLCANGTIPMRRITLEEMSRFPTLAAFFGKGPGAAGQALDASAPQAQVAHTHKYAYAGQSVTNYGGTSNLNLWSPHVRTGLTHVFTLSQQWYTNKTNNLTQTAEVGWQNYPEKYGVDKPVQFIYWTADGYGSTGCYNLDCPGFVQTNNSVTLGMGWTSYSSPGGPQFYVPMTYRLMRGRWWLGIDGTWVGYYPASLYGTGGMRTSATKIKFGGETVGGLRWPRMGGDFAATGMGRAAFHSAVRYFTSGASGTTAAAELIGVQFSPTCYTTETHNFSRSFLETYFFFGGPGGTGC